MAMMMMLMMTMVAMMMALLMVMMMGTGEQRLGVELRIVGSWRLFPVIVVVPGTPLVGDGDGDVVGEHVAPVEGVEQREHGHEDDNHGRDAGQEEREELRERVPDLERVLDRRDRRRRHRARVRPPRDREPASTRNKKKKMKQQQKG
jgi:hypothetical protein